LINQNVTIAVNNGISISILRIEYDYDVIDTFNMAYVCKGYYLPELIYNRIQSEMNYDLSDARLIILGHYFDSNDYKIYLIVKLVHQDVQTIGVFALDCREDEASNSCYFLYKFVYL